MSQRGLDTEDVEHVPAIAMGAWRRLAPEPVQRGGIVIIAVLVGVAVVALAGGLGLWLPKAGEPAQRANLGQGLLSGAVVAVALLVVQIGLNDQQRSADKRDRLRDRRLTAELSSDLTGITLAGRDLRTFFLTGKRMRSANLQDADLRGSNLASTDLSGASVSRAKLSGSILSEAIMDDAELVEAHLENSEFEQASLKYAHLERAKLTGAFAINADLTAASMTRIVAPRIDLTGAVLRGADLKGASLAKATLVDADLRQAELNGANLRGADLTGARLAGAFGSADPRVKYDKHTRWPAGYPAKLLGPISNATTPAVRFRNPEGGGTVSCGSQCFQSTPANRGRYRGILVVPPKTGTACRTGSWRGTWQHIARRDRNGFSPGLHVCRRLR